MTGTLIQHGAAKAQFKLLT